MSILDILFKSKAGKENTEKAGVGGSTTTGFSSGRDIGSGTDRPGGSSAATASAVPSARSAIFSGAGTKKPAPAMPSAPAANPAQSSSSGPAMPTMKATDTHDEDCGACKAGTCGFVNKGMTTKKYGVPFYMRSDTFDKSDLERSATSQTSKMYTSIAPQVANELDMVAERSSAAKKDSALKSQEAASTHVKKVREEMANRANIQRTTLKFTR